MYWLLGVAVRLEALGLRLFCIMPVITAAFACRSAFLWGCSYLIAKRMADVFEVSLDYLVGNAEQEIDKATLNRINEINKMTPTDKNLVCQFLDAFIMKVKL
jgi:hypothetical protein